MMKKIVFSLCFIAVVALAYFNTLHLNFEGMEEEINPTMQKHLDEEIEANRQELFNNVKDEADTSFT